MKCQWVRDSEVLPVILCISAKHLRYTFLYLVSRQLHSNILLAPQLRPNSNGRLFLLFPLLHVNSLHRRLQKATPSDKSHLCIPRRGCDRANKSSGTVAFVGAICVSYSHSKSTPANCVFVWGDVLCNESTCWGWKRTRYYWWKMCDEVTSAASTHFLEKHSFHMVHIPHEDTKQQLYNDWAKVWKAQRNLINPQT